MMVTAMSRMRPSHISAHWKEAARSGRSSLRRTSIWHKGCGGENKDIAERYRFSCIRDGRWLPLGICR